MSHEWASLCFNLKLKSKLTEVRSPSALFFSFALHSLYFKERPFLQLIRYNRPYIFICHVNNIPVVVKMTGVGLHLFLAMLYHGIYNLCTLTPTLSDVLLNHATFILNPLTETLLIYTRPQQLVDSVQSIDPYFAISKPPKWPKIQVDRKIRVDSAK